jgi:hypothetical protein
MIIGLLGGMAVAQTCPVQIETIHTLDMAYGDVHFKAKWKNVSDKQIVGAKFNATFFDATGDRHDVIEDWTTDQKVKPGQSKSSSWPDGYYIRSYGHHAKVEIWPQKIVFADGTKWEDDGSASCKGVGGYYH